MEFLADVDAAAQLDVAADAIPTDDFNNLVNSSEHAPSNTTTNVHAGNDPCIDAGGTAVVFDPLYTGPALATIADQLAGDASYCFRARAVNSKGNGEWGTVRCHRTAGASEPVRRTVAFCHFAAYILLSSFAVVRM
jgi:hypothetical protein